MSEQAHADLAAIYKLLTTPSGARPALPHFQNDFDAVRKIAEPYYREQEKAVQDLREWRERNGR